MAVLGDCKACTKPVSNEARACPHCGQPNPYSCFPAHSRVRTPFGERRIAALHPGDDILSMQSDGSLVVRPVVRVLQHPRASVSTILFRSAREPLRATAFHTMLTDRGWVRVDRLRPGDRLVEGFTSTARNIDAKVARVISPMGLEPVFNLITAREHNFIVEGAVAHNFTFMRGARILFHRLVMDVHAVPALGVPAIAAR